LSKFAFGDDVVVNFDGVESRGEVLRVSNGYVLCNIDIDPEGDYGQLTSRLATRSTVCVKESNVRYPQDD